MKKIIKFFDEKNANEAINIVAPLIIALIIWSFIYFIKR